MKSITKKLLSIFILFSLIVPVALADAPSIPYILSGDVISNNEPVDGFDLIAKTNTGIYNCAIENGDYGKNFMCLISISCKLSESGYDCPETVFYINDNIVGITKQVVPGERGTLNFVVSAEDLVIAQPESTPQPQNNGGSSGGSGGGSGGSGATQSASYDFSEYEEAEYTLAVNQGSIKRFTLDGDTIHSVRTDKIHGTSVELTVYSDPIKVNLMVGEEKTLDLDADGVLDIVLSLEKISNNKAYVVLSKYFAPEIVQDNVNNQQVIVNDESEQESQSNWITGALIASPNISIIGSVGAVALLFVALIFVKKRNMQTVIGDSDNDQSSWNEDIE
jgi:hypothetical protein